MKKVCLYFCALFCFLVCFSSCKTEIIKYLPAEEKEDSTVVMITWKGSFASADEIENLEYLWAYYNTTNGCSYVYDGEKWTLLASAGKNGADGTDGTSGAGVSVFLMYNLDGGKFTEEAPLVYTYGTVLKLLIKPVKPDYVFTGWTYDGKPITQIDGSFIYGKEITATWISVSELFKQKNLTITESTTLKFADIFADINDDNVEITDFSFLRDFLVNLYETKPGIKIELDLTGIVSNLVRNLAFEKSPFYHATVFNKTSFCSLSVCAFI